jgi:hypothetical protein
MSKRALFFLRHYNDIDHMVPVMHAWLSRGYAADVVVYSLPEYLSDYRFALLKSFEGFSLQYIDEFLDHEALNRKRDIVVGPRGELPKDVRISELYDEAVIGRIFSQFNPNIVCFDWIMSTSAAALPVAQRATALATQRGLPIVSLPHGDSPHFNEMIAADDLNFSWREIYSSGNLFDAVVVPNELCAKRYRPFMPDDRIRVLGSPRYNSAWLSVLDAMTPTYEFGAHDSLNIVMFLRSPQYPIFWQEVIRTIQMLTQRPGIKLVVKHHTRPCGNDPLRSFCDALEDRPIPNLRFAFDDVHSGSLLKWCDVVMDVATSVSFEAVKLNKPVLAMEYLHAGYSTIARYIPNSEMRCRDDVLNILEEFGKRGTNGFYRQRDRVHFMSEMIDVPDGDVLNRYVNFLEEACGAKQSVNAEAA